MKPGYKQTEVGVLPVDWGVREVSELAKIITGPFGTLLKASEYTDFDGVPQISVGEIGDGFFRVADHTSKIPPAVTSRLPQYLLRVGDVVFGRKGAVDRSALVTERENGWFLGSDGISVRPIVQCHPQYLAAQFSSSDTKSWLQQNAIGTTMASLNQKILGRVRLPFAPLDEQVAIAAALSDVDALLAGLDKLIAKKRDIKQATMQQLLTGKTRLPGFAGAWESVRLGDCLTFIKNAVFSRAELEVDGGVRYLHYGDIHTSTDVYLDSASVAMPFLSEDRASGVARLRDGDLVFVDATEDLAGVGKSVEVAGLADGQLVAGLHTIAVRFDKKVLADGFKAYLQFIPDFRRHLCSLAAGTKVLSTNRSHISSAQLALPAVEEQEAIAFVLRSMDGELKKLEAQREKTRLLKQGMMQELLTGRTRLV